MPDEKVKKLVLASLFAALAAVMTTVIRVPSPMGGYVNLGDCAVLLAAWVQEITWTGPSGAETPVIIADSLWIRVLDR